MTQEQLRMQMLAGIITEGQYKAKLNENQAVIFTPEQKETYQNALMKRAGLIKEERVAFNGTTTNQLYNIVKDFPNSLIFANGEHYSIDVEDMRSSLQEPTIIGTDDDGREFEIDVADIEFIKL